MKTILTMIILISFIFTQQKEYIEVIPAQPEVFKKDVLILTLEHQQAYDDTGAVIVDSVIVKQSMYHESTFEDSNGVQVRDNQMQGDPEEYMNSGDAVSMKVKHRNFVTKLLKMLKQ